MRTWLCHTKGMLHTKSRNPLQFFITEVNEYIIIRLKYGEQWGRDCVIPRGIYGPKGRVPWFFSWLRLIHRWPFLVKYGEQWGCGCVIPGCSYTPKGGVVLKTHLNLLMIWCWLSNTIIFQWNCYLPYKYWSYYRAWIFSLVSHNSAMNLGVVTTHNYYQYLVISVLLTLV